MCSLLIIITVQLDAYRKKKAFAKKEKKNQPSSSSGLNFAKNEDQQNALGERVASKPPFLVADDDEPKGDDSMKMTFTTTPTTNEEEEETANTTETFAFTMAPDAVRYSNGNTKGEETLSRTHRRCNLPLQLNNRDAEWRKKKKKEALRRLCPRLRLDFLRRELQCGWG